MSSNSKFIFLTCCFFFMFTIIKVIIGYSKERTGRSINLVSLIITGIVALITRSFLMVP